MNRNVVPKGDAPEADSQRCSTPAPLGRGFGAALACLVLLIWVAQPRSPRLPINRRVRLPRSAFTQPTFWVSKGPRATPKGRYRFEATSCNFKRTGSPPSK